MGWVTCFQFLAGTVSLHDHPVSYLVNTRVSVLDYQTDQSPLESTEIKNFLCFPYAPLLHSVRQRQCAFPLHFNLGSRKRLAINFLGKQAQYSLHSEKGIFSAESNPSSECSQSLCRRSWHNSSILNSRKFFLLPFRHFSRVYEVRISASYTPPE